MRDNSTVTLPLHMLSLEWAVRPEWMRAAVDLLNRRGGRDAVIDVGALEAFPAQRKPQTERASVRGAVGFLPIRGMIFRHSNLFVQWCGGTSYAQLAIDFQALLDDPNVETIVLDLDSPGGEVTGCQEFADQVYKARARKRIVAYVDGSACSAAYWIASAAERVITSPTGLLGSIGTMASIVDDREAMASAGYREIVLVSSQSPRKHVDVASEDGQREIVAVLDAFAQVFVEDVARNRGVTAERVLADFGRGGVFVGRAAVAQGLADAIGDFEGLVASLQQPGLPASGAAAARSSQSENMMQTRTLKLEARTGAPQAAAVGSGDEVTIRAERAVMCTDGDTGTVVEVLENVTAVAVETSAGVVKYLLEAEVEVTKAAETAGGEGGGTEPAEAPAQATGELADVAALEARYPALCQELRTQAITAERTRVTKIQALAGKGPAKTLQACIDDAACSYEMAAARMIEAADAERAARGKAFRQDDKDIPIPAVETPAAESPTEARVSRILQSAAMAEGR